MAARLTRAVEAAPELTTPDGIAVPVRVSVGQQLAPVGHQDASLLLRAADHAMYAAKRGREGG
jgi:GGDEF domain-containing protein